MLPRWIVRLALATALLGVVLYATAGHCAEPAGDTAVAAQLAALRTEVSGMRDQINRLVQAQDRDRERRPAFEADLVAAREAVMSEVRTARTDHEARISALEEARWYLLGVLAVLGVVGAAIWRGYRLEVRKEHEPGRGPPPTPPTAQS